MHVPEQRTALYRAGTPYRRATAASRRVADVIVCGAQKCGTTYLADLLGSQEGFFTPPTKEIHFFNGFWDRGAGWYRAHFERRTSADLQVDASPSYMIHPEVAVRIRAVNPAAKLVFLLRDPAERARSHFQHNVRAGCEPLDFAAAIAAEEGRIAADLAAATLDPGHVARQLALYGYRSRGVYAGFLEPFHRVFPAGQLLVLDSAKLFRNDPDELDLLSSFLGREVRIPDRAVRTNAGSYDREDDPVMAELRSFYEPLDAGLADLTGRRFEWMRATVTL